MQHLFTYVTTFCVSTSHSLQLLSPEAVSSCFPSGDQLSCKVKGNKARFGWYVLINVHMYVYIGE